MNKISINVITAMLMISASPIVLGKTQPKEHKDGAQHELIMLTAHIMKKPAPAKAMEERRRTAVKKFDANGDRKLGQKEGFAAAKWLITQAKLRDKNALKLAWVDNNGNGKIEEQEERIWIDRTNGLVYESEGGHLIGCMICGWTPVNNDDVSPKGPKTKGGKVLKKRIKRK